MPYTPKTRRSYKGSITNTDRWQQFQNKPGDVFVCTPPKCGTTWTVTIVTMLALGKCDVAPQELVQWFDAEVVAIDDVVHEASSFGSMKSQAARFAPFSDQGYWRDPKAFFDSAGTHKWAGKVGDAAISLYREKIAQLLDPTDVAWLENGETG